MSRNNVLGFFSSFFAFFSIAEFSDPLSHSSQETDCVIGRCGAAHPEMRTNPSEKELESLLPEARKPARETEPAAGTALRQGWRSREGDSSERVARAGWSGVSARMALHQRPETPTKLPQGFPGPFVSRKINPSPPLLPRHPWPALQSSVS